MAKLNIGCGNDYMEGYTNIDIAKGTKADLVRDIVSEGIPCEDDTVEEIVCNNMLTQILFPKDFVKTMNEFWRVTKTDGVIKIRVPNAEHICAWQDPMDCRRFTDQSFTYMQHDHRRYPQYGKHYGFKPFMVELVDDNGIQMVFHLTPVK